MNMSERLQENDNKYIVNSYGRFDLVIDHGKGATCVDTAGKEYIDLTSGIGVNSLGYSEPGWVSAVSDQLGKYQHCSNLYYSEPGIELAEKLVKRSGLAKVLFVNSGAEANETAFKIARKYGNVISPIVCKENIGGGDVKAGILNVEAPSTEAEVTKGRGTIISLKGSFHGRTIAAITATGQEKFHKDFEPFAPGFCYAEPGNVCELERLFQEEHPCAMIIEMVQGEGGVNTLDLAYVKMAEKLCREYDAALIVDEVQTGIGRTGTFFCYEQFGIEPDIVSFAKGIGNGLPIGGVICNEKYADVLKPGDHGCTFGMNPAACAGANYVVDTIDDTFLQEVREKASYIRKHLESLPKVKETTGLGLMIGITLDGIAPIDAAKVLLEKGVMTLTAGSRLRMLPPLNITYEEIDKAFTAVDSVLA